MGAWDDQSLAMGEEKGTGSGRLTWPGITHGGTECLGGTALSGRSHRARRQVPPGCTAFMKFYDASLGGHGDMLLLLRALT